jgi:hypothetical protein
MSSSKEEIEEARVALKYWQWQTHDIIVIVAEILAAALRASEARAELLERHCREAYAHGNGYGMSGETWKQLLERHAREREALE